MVAMKRWLLWELVSNPDPTKKPQKKPHYTNGSPRGRTDTAEDRASLVSYDEAKAALAKKDGQGVWGLGFALGSDGTGFCWQGIDFDEIVENKLSDLEKEWVSGNFASFGYVEVTPSGLGLHIIGYGQPFPTLGPNESGIEAYAGGRFFTVTEKPVQRSSAEGLLADLTNYVAERLVPKHAEQRFDSTSAAGTIYVDDLTVKHLREALAHLHAEDGDDWIAIGNALKTIGETGYGLWSYWSQKSGKYKPWEVEERWKGFKPREGTSYRLVFEIAQKHGWFNPMSNAAQGIGGTTSPGAAASPPFDPFAGGYTSAELRNKDLHEHRWIIPGLLPEGLSVLAGLPKVGKSFLNLNIGIAAASGGEVLGQRCQKCRVLYLALEDGQLRMQKRQDDIIAETDPGSNELHIYHEWPCLDDGGLDALNAWCDRYSDLGLILIDTLALVAPKKKAGGGNAYEQDVEALKPLHRFAQDRRIAVLVTTHFRKLREGTDILERVMGSIGITSTADAIITIGDTITASPGAPRSIYVRGREVPESYYVAQLVHGRWKLQDGTKLDIGRGDTQAAILDVLVKSGQPLTVQEIALKLPDKTFDAVRVAFYRRGLRTKVSRLADGRYEVIR